MKEGSTKGEEKRGVPLFCLDAVIRFRRHNNKKNISFPKKEKWKEKKTIYIYIIIIMIIKKRNGPLSFSPFLPSEKEKREEESVYVIKREKRRRRRRELKIISVGAPLQPAPEAVINAGNKEENDLFHVNHRPATSAVEKSPGYLSNWNVLNGLSTAPRSPNWI